MRRKMTWQKGIDMIYNRFTTNSAIMCLSADNCPFIFTIIKKYNFGLKFVPKRFAQKLV